MYGSVHRLKPIHLNLAARPYRDHRPLYAVVVVVSLLIAFLMLNNIDTYYRYVRETRTTRSDIAALEAEMEQERRRAEVSAAQMRQIDLPRLSQQTKFVNAQLAERAFSWSELLDRLESVVPADVRILSVAPTFLDNGLVSLSLSGEAKTADGMTSLLVRLQRSQHFANAFPDSEDRDPNAGFRFSMSVDFRPSIARVVKR